MAKLSFYQDTRSGKDSYPIKIRISHKKQNAYVSTGVKVTTEQWDEQNGAVINHEKAKNFNALIGSRMMSATRIIKSLELADKVNEYSAAQLKDLIENDGVLRNEECRGEFYDFYLSFMEKKSKPATRSSYQQALNNLIRFDPLLKERTFEELDSKWFEAFDAWFDSRSVSVNARAVYYRNIKAVFNAAISDEITVCYPFRKFKIKKEPTAKRNLSLYELRLLLNYPIKDVHQQKYRDLFMLMFYLRGINAVDLFKAKESNIRNGRLNYIRSKTGKPYSVKIEPEARELIDLYRGKDYLIDVCDGAVTQQEIDTKYKGFLKRMDRGLKKIGEVKRVGRGGKMQRKPILPFISQYWCRHTAATLMSEMDISNETIAASLGHDHGNRVTNIYIEYNEKKVDVANRQLIDYVKGR